MLMFEEKLEMEVTMIMKLANMMIMGIASFMKELGDLIRRGKMVRNATKQTAPSIM